MKKLFGILMIFSAILMASNSYAQENRQLKEKMSIEERAQKRTNHLKEKLSLNDAQSQSVYKLLFEQERQKEKDRAIRKERVTRVDNSMLDILSEKQMANYNAMKAERKEAGVKVKKRMRSKAAHRNCCEAK